MSYKKRFACTVADIAAQTRNAIVGGPFGSDLVSRDYCLTGVPVIRGANMGLGRWVAGDFAYVTHEKAMTLAANCAYPGDIIFTQRGTLGQVAIVPNARFEQYLISQSQMKITVDPKKVDSLFLYYVFSSAEQQEYIKINAIQTGVPHTNLGILKRTPLQIPPLDEQKRIAAILGGIDDKIDLNRRINQTLEAMAQAIFKSWFVDFDPVKAKIAAKAEGRDPLRAAMSAISGKAEDELDALPSEQYEQLAATAAPFPDEMVESELGEIPEGWRAAPFGSLLAHTIGGDWGSDAPDDGNDTRVAIIRGTDIPDLDSVQSLRVPIRYTSQKKLASRQLQVGDIVLEVSGGSKDQPTGRSIRITANAMSEFDCPMEPASFCRLLRPISAEIGLILGLHLKHIYSIGKTWEYQNQSTGIANFQTSHFLESELVVAPPPDVTEKFFVLVNPWLERRHDPQSRRLAEVRDSLLPKLLSGELSVAELD